MRDWISANVELSFRFSVVVGAVLDLQDASVVANNATAISARNRRVMRGLTQNAPSSYRHKKMTETIARPRS
jgi:hypothetical protein